MSGIIYDAGGHNRQFWHYVFLPHYQQKHKPYNATSIGCVYTTDI